MHHDQTKLHLPVLLEPVLHYLAPRAGNSYLDLTAGYGGHAQAILERTEHPERATLVDRDGSSISALAEKFADRDVRILHMDFLSASRQLQAEGKAFDIILADLGVSSPHLNESDRGFAINAEGPLDMRMDQSQTLTAADIVNGYSAEELAALLHHYGEEPKARRIAQLIVQNRPITTTTVLANVVARAWPGHSRIHPATRTFQALRIAVNDELGLLEKALPLWIDLLKPGGRLAIISFHSLEDRLVKQAFVQLAGGTYDAEVHLLTKHPVVASSEELAFNPRARSAKLRVVAK